MNELGVSQQQVKQGFGDIVVVLVIVVCLLLGVGIAVILYRRRHVANQVDFEVFSSEQGTKDSGKAESTGTITPLPVLKGEEGEKEQQQVAASQQFKKHRRRKRDRIRREEGESNSRGEQKQVQEEGRGGQFSVE